MVFLIRKEGTSEIFGNAQNNCLLCGNLLGAPFKDTITKSCSGKKVRVGCRRSDNLLISLCDSQEQKSTRRFNDKLLTIKSVFPFLQSSLADKCSLQKEEIEQRFKELTHNVVTYNAKCIQAAYLLIPHDKYVSASDKSSFIKSCVTKNLDETADSLLTILKNIELTKHAITVYEKLHTNKFSFISTLQRHKIHKLFQLALNIFWRDFNKKKIKMNHGVCEYYVRVDFESFMAALIHLVGNMSKYILPESEVTIDYKMNDENFVIVTISMLSLFVYPEEIDKIWEIGYSGKLAKKLQKDGSGIEMHAIQELVTLNKGQFFFKPNVKGTTLTTNDVLYSHNVAMVQVPSAPR